MKMQARVINRRAPWPMAWLALAFGVLAFGVALAATRPVHAQEESVALASAEELKDIVGPIALYPDDLVALVLPASTYPLQVVQAARFLEQRESNSDLQPNEDWDDSVVALLNYPEVLKLLNDDLDWTYDLGAAVLNQRADVLSAIQDFRDEAYAAGNLRSDERQTVARENDTIEITPADPEVIYIPYYEPERVVVYQPAPVYYYYPRPYPVYYYPYPAHHHFGSSFFWGVNSWFSIGWHSHHVHVYDPFYHGHPYYGRSYYDPFYVRNVYVNVNNYYRRYPDYVWQPQDRYGGRPAVRGSEGRVYTPARVPRRGVLDSSAAAARTREGSVNRTSESGASGSAAVNAQSTRQPRRGVLDSNAMAARTREGAATSANGSVAPSAAAAAESAARQPRRGVPSTSYRNRSIETGQPPSAATAQRGASGQSSAAPAAQSTYRRGGGMSQSLERSTGMPREVTRSAPAMRQSTPAIEAPSGGGASVQRSDSGAGQRSHPASDGGGGSYRGAAGSERGAHPAARGGAGR